MSVKKLLYDWYWEREKDFHPHADNEVWVSWLTTCVIKLRRDKERLQTRDPFYLLRGVLFHRGVQSVLAKFGYADEVRVEKQVGEYVVRGSIDVVSPDGVPVEVKTTKKLLLEYNLEHVLQTQIYAYLLNKDYGLLLYLTEDELREYRVGVDGTVVDDKGQMYFALPPMRPKRLQGIVEDFVKGRRIHPFNECARCIYRNECEYSLVRRDEKTGGQGQKR